MAEFVAYGAAVGVGVVLNVLHVSGLYFDVRRAARSEESHVQCCADFRVECSDDAVVQ